MLIEYVMNASLYKGWMHTCTYFKRLQVYNRFLITWFFRFTGTGEPTALTADSIISTIEVVDGSNAVQTSMQLGDLAKLKLTLTVTPYIGRDY